MAAGTRRGAPERASSSGDETHLSERAAPEARDLLVYIQVAHGLVRPAGLAGVRVVHKHLAAWRSRENVRKTQATELGEVVPGALEYRIRCVGGESMEVRRVAQGSGPAHLSWRR